MGLFASSGSGKSHLISEILTDPLWGVEKNIDCNRIFLICPTISLDNAYQKVIEHYESKSDEDKHFDKNKQVFEKELESSLANVYK